MLIGDGDKLKSSFNPGIFEGLLYYDHQFAEWRFEHYPLILKPCFATRLGDVPIEISNIEIVPTRVNPLHSTVPRETLREYLYGENGNMLNTSKLFLSLLQNYYYITSLGFVPEEASLDTIVVYDALNSRFHLKAKKECNAEANNSRVESLSRWLNNFRLEFIELASGFKLDFEKIFLEKNV